MLTIAVRIDITMQRKECQLLHKNMLRYVEVNCKIRSSKDGHQIIIEVIEAIQKDWQHMLTNLAKNVFAPS
jgi:hypothetical protein